MWSRVVRGRPAQRQSPVGAAAHERGRERVPEDVSGHVVIEPAAIGDAGDHVVGALGAQPLAALVEKQRGAVFRSGPVRRSSSQWVSIYGFAVGPAWQDRGIGSSCREELPDAKNRCNADTVS